MRTIHCRNGNLYLDAETYATYLESFGAAVLLSRERQVYLMPVQQAAGGLLVRQINARGERVVHATEFLEREAIAIDADIEIEATWDSELHALALDFGDLSR